tara:strand:- start:42 stop:278 length:237 start_codon:yes stop_codon:yes gene_type:complete
MATLRLFASIKQIAGTGSLEIHGSTVGEVVDEASKRFGFEFSELTKTCRIWLNGNPAAINSSVVENDEIALLPPVSGG